MPRVKGGPYSRQRRRKVLRAARGYWGRKSKTYRAANEQVLRALRDAFIHRRSRKRDFRRLWITRINAAARRDGMSYSRFMSGLRQAGIDLNRKMLADLAVRDREAFRRLVQTAREQTG